MRGRGALDTVQAQIGFALHRIEPVAGKAGVRENRADIPVEQELAWRGLSRPGQAGCARDGDQPQAKQEHWLT